jgi:hypothetical protein
MKTYVIILVIFCPILLSGQIKPAYCDEIPVSYDKTISTKSALPRFPTAAVTAYKVQVAILKFTHPRDYPFHKELVARYRPCEQLWVIESKKTCKTKREAEQLKEQFRSIGYTGAYVIELIGYE